MRRFTPRRGSAAIEFALTLPIWLGIVFALVDFGYLFYRFSALDNAANVGCRDGAIVDPGDTDQHIAQVIARASDRMREVLVALGDPDCDTCVFQAYTLGSPPQRSLVCVVTRDFDPMLGLFVGERTLTTVQVARLEWQREAP
jgi:hypothetical protein